jgi:hypothetical protein
MKKKQGSRSKIPKKFTACRCSKLNTVSMGDSGALFIVYLNIKTARLRSESTNFCPTIIRPFSV